MAALHVPDLPNAVPFDAVTRALAVLGIPIESVRSVELGTRTVKVTQLIKQSGTAHAVTTEIPVRHDAEPTAG
jgi:hypothetical protein